MNSNAWPAQKKFEFLQKIDPKIVIRKYTIPAYPLVSEERTEFHVGTAIRITWDGRVDYFVSMQQCKSESQCINKYWEVITGLTECGRLVKEKCYNSERSYFVFDEAKEEFRFLSADEIKEYEATRERCSYYDCPDQFWADSGTNAGGDAFICVKCNEDDDDIVQKSAPTTTASVLALICKVVIVGVVTAVGIVIAALALGLMRSNKRE